VLPDGSIDLINKVVVDSGLTPYGVTRQGKSLRSDEHRLLREGLDNGDGLHLDTRRCPLAAAH
jgi:hypothetical protein